MEATQKNILYQNYLLTCKRIKKNINFGQTEMKKAYWIANYTEIKDEERLKKYAVKAKEAVEKYSGKIIARSANNVTLEGREMVRVALAEFPDIETAKKCYNSEEYVEARKHLENNATREHIIFEGM